MKYMKRTLAIISSFVLLGLISLMLLSIELLNYRTTLRNVNIEIIEVRKALTAERDSLRQYRLEMRHVVSEQRQNSGVVGSPDGIPKFRHEEKQCSLSIRSVQNAKPPR